MTNKKRFIQILLFLIFLFSISLSFNQVNAQGTCFCDTDFQLAEDCGFTDFCDPGYVAEPDCEAKPSDTLSECASLINFCSCEIDPANPPCNDLGVTCDAGGFACCSGLSCGAITNTCVNANDPAQECTPGDTQFGGTCGNCGTDRRDCQSDFTWGAWYCSNEGECVANSDDIDGSCGLGGTWENHCGNDCVYEGWQCVGEGVCSPGDTEPGGSCGNCGTNIRTCQADYQWGPFICSDEGVCTPGASQNGGSCGNCGTSTRSCTTSCAWSGWTCSGEGVCSPGSIDIDGACGETGTFERTCSGSCTYGGWVCNECTAGETQIVGSCGNCGDNVRTCQADNTWGAPVCTNQGVCSPGARSTSGSCGNCGENAQYCTSLCAWGTFQCENEGICSPGATQDQGVCEFVGTLVDTCNVACNWDDPAICVGGGVCAPTSTETRSPLDATCISNCGTEERTCNLAGEWGGYVCINQGICTIGSNSCVGTDSRTCTGLCAWQNDGAIIGQCGVECTSGDCCNLGTFKFSLAGSQPTGKVDSLIGNDFCQTNDVFHTYRDYSCTGTSSASTFIDTNILQKSCLSSCLDNLGNRNVSTCLSGACTYNVEFANSCLTSGDCSDCGQGFFNLCDEAECALILNACYFDPGFISGNCQDCAGASCYDYHSSIAVTNNDCNLGNCAWCPSLGTGANIASDADNCGVCGNSCNNKPNVASASCSSAICSVTTCEPGFIDANGIGSDGCEVDTNSDVNNCGAIGNSCSDKQTTQCISGVCQVCALNFWDIDGSGTGTDVNGCEYSCTLSNAGNECCADDIDNDCDGGIDEQSVCDSDIDNITDINAPICGGVPHITYETQDENTIRTILIRICQLYKYNCDFLNNAASDNA